MDENLIGYLLDALDPEERQALEARLADSPETRARLERLERALRPLAADRDAPAPPPGLVLRTLARVAEAECADRLPSPKALLKSRRPEARPRPWLRLADLLTAAAALLLTLGLLV